MSEEEIIEIVQDYINYIRFKENARYSINQWFMAIEDLLDLYNKEKIRNSIITNWFGTAPTYEDGKYLNYINKDKIRDLIAERKFELQQEYKDFEDDIKLNTLEELLEE